MDDCKNGKLSELTLLRQHAWDYFELHANQRISLFRFYIIFLSLFFTGASFMYVRYPSERFLEELAGIALSLSFAFITMMFHFLDRRNKQLIHYAEDALRMVEKEFPSIVKLSGSKGSNDDDHRLFIREDNDTKNGKCCIQHSTCFGNIFIAGYIFASLFLIASVWSIIYYSVYLELIKHSIYIHF